MMRDISYSVRQMFHALRCVAWKHCLPASGASRRLSLTKHLLTDAEVLLWLSVGYIMQPLILREGVISFVSLRFCFPVISSIGHCRNFQYLQGFVGSAHTRPPE